MLRSPGVWLAPRWCGGGIPVIFQEELQKPVLRFGVLITGASWRRVDEQMKMQSSTRIIQLIERSESNGPITYWTVITLNGPWDMGVLITLTSLLLRLKLP